MGKCTTWTRWEYSILDHVRALLHEKSNYWNIYWYLLPLESSASYDHSSYLLPQCSDRVNIDPRSGTGNLFESSRKFLSDHLIRSEVGQAFTQSH